jgi:hypothetical protein
MHDSPPPPPRTKNNAEHASRIAPIETSRPALPPPPGATSWALLPALRGRRRWLLRKTPAVSGAGRVARRLITRVSLKVIGADGAPIERRQSGGLVARRGNLECGIVAAFITVHREQRLDHTPYAPVGAGSADMLLCKVAGAVTRKGYLYMVFLKVPVPRLLPSQLVEPVSPQPCGQRLYGNFLGHVHITALSRSRRRPSTCPRFAAAQSQQRRATPQRPPLAGRS